MLDIAFVLHRYPYQETSLLLKVFTREQGLVTLIIKGAKKKYSDSYSLLQCFQPLKIEYTLKGDLGTLKQVERHGVAPVLVNESLYSGFYLNELLLFLLHPHDPLPAIFDLYAHTLEQLDIHVEFGLRLFELKLLSHLGFLPDFGRDDTGALIQTQAQYLLMPGHEPQLVTDMNQGLTAHIFAGADLQSFAQGNWTSDSLKAAKRLCRIFIDQHTRGKIFKSRELFVASKKLMPISTCVGG